MEANMPDRQRLLELALKGLEAERANIDDEIAQIKSQLNPRPTVAKSVTTASPITPPKEKTMSAAARKKISDHRLRLADLRGRVAGFARHAASQVRKSESVVRSSSGKKQNGGDR